MFKTDCRVIWSKKIKESSARLQHQVTSEYFNFGHPFIELWKENGRNGCLHKFQE